MMLKAWRELILGPFYLYHKQLIANSYKWTDIQIDEYMKTKKIRFQKTHSTKITTKYEIAGNLKKYDYRLFRMLTKRVTTGGTTGTPFNFNINIFSRRQKERAYIYDIWECVGYKPFDLRVVIRGNIGHDLIRYNIFENAYYISPSLLIPENKEKVIMFLRSLNPFFLHCYPSSLLQFINYVGEGNFARFNVRGIMAGSEVFPKEQMRWLVEKFHLQVAHWYGHSEYAVLAKYCWNCNGFHFYPTYGLPEFEKNQETGFKRIIATLYNTIGTRFVRYDTQDLAVVNNKKCEHCAFPRVETIIGREQECFFDKERRKQSFGPFLFGIHGVFWSRIRDIQFVQESTGEISVFVVGAKQEYRNWLEGYLSNRFGLVRLSFFYVSEIEKNEKYETSVLYKQD